MQCLYGNALCVRRDQEQRQAVTVSRFTKGTRDNDQRIRMMGIRNIPLHAVQRVALPVAFSFGGNSQRIEMRRLVQRQRKARLAASNLRQPFGLLLCTAA